MIKQSIFVKVCNSVSLQIHILSDCDISSITGGKQMAKCTLLLCFLWEWWEMLLWLTKSLQTINKKIC